MWYAIRSLALAALLSACSGTASAVTYVFDYATPFLPPGHETAPPFSVIVADSLWTQGGHVSIFEESDFYTPSPQGPPNLVPYDGVEVGWPEIFGAAYPCDPALPSGGRGGCGVSTEWLGAIEFVLRADFQGDLLVGGEFAFRWPGNYYRMTGDANGLWTVDLMQTDYEGSLVCGAPEDSPCGSTGRFVRIAEPGTLGLFGLGLAGLGLKRRRRSGRASSRA